MTPSRRAGCGKSACPVRCGGDRKRSDGTPYTGTKPETADTDKGCLHATAPVPDPTGRFDVAVFEEEQESLPLPIEIAEPLPEWSLRRSDSPLPVDPRAKLVQNRACVLVASCAPLLGGIAGAGGLALDSEQARDDAYAFESDTVAGARGFYESAARVSPAAGSLAAGAFEEGGDACAVALHGAREIVAEKPPDTVGVALWRIEERDPTRVGPAPHGAVADAFGRFGIENREAGRIGPKQARRARLFLDEARDRGEQINRGGNGAPERLRSDIYAGAREARGLPLDGLMLNVLVAHGFDDESVGELSALDDLRRR